MYLVLSILEAYITDELINIVICKVDALLKKIKLLIFKYGQINLISSQDGQAK